ncbi:MAG: phosphate ABC transporter substrate-binding protein [Desulfobulbaceae bacterium]|jgi:phosphate transport system substrate-binding protein|nr:phosphate ABC transporter substrate-binding protein [Desulfobulbaceae bacterium]MDY0350049.1 phosphate ABC transporter substrate-binding protein [Desulfobulbaceae bacterium]
MKTKSVAVCAVALLVLAFGPGAFASALDAFKGEKGEIKIAGGTAHIPVMKEAADRIMGMNPDIQISIAGGGSGVGIKQAGEGLVDIGNTGRALSDDEISQHGLQVFKWAVDGVAIVVNPANPVRALSQDQLIAIFAGRIANWKEVGGGDQRINLYTRDEASGTREVFWEKALNKGDIAPTANFIVSNGAMKGAISQDPYGIGYVSVGHIDESVAPVAFNGIEPSMQTVKEGKYPIARGLYSNTRGEPAGLVKKFIDYLFTEEGQQIIAEKGFIPVQ